MHTIRLRGPWECSVDELTAQKVRVPGDDWQLAAAAADQSFRLQRRFNRPTGLQGDEVRLVVQFAPVAASVLLNGRLLGTVAGERKQLSCSVKAQLQDQNVVQILVHDVQQLAAAASPVCDVVLEIGD